MLFKPANLEAGLPGMRIRSGTTDGARGENIPVELRIVLEDARSLSITTAYLKHQLSAPIDDDIGRPDFYIDAVHLARLDGKDVGGEILAVGKPWPILRALLVNLPVAHP